MSGDTQRLINLRVYAIVKIMRSLLLFAVFIGLVTLFFVGRNSVDASSYDGSHDKIGAYKSDAVTPLVSAANNLAIIAQSEDRDEGHKAIFSHCLEELQARFNIPPERIADYIYNTKTVMGKRGISQRLVDVAMDLAEIASVQSPPYGTCESLSLNYVFMRILGNDRKDAVSMVIFFQNRPKNDKHMEISEHNSIMLPQRDSFLPAITQVGPLFKPEVITHVDLKDKWNHAITVTVKIVKAGAESDLAQARLQVINFIFDASYGREGQIANLKDKIIATLGEDIRDLLDIDVDWKL